MGGNLSVSGAGFDIPLSPLAGAAGVLFVIVMVALILLVFMQLISLILKGLPKMGGALTFKQEKRSALATIIAIGVILIFALILLRLGHPSLPSNFHLLTGNITRTIGTNSTSGATGFATSLFNGLVFALFLPMVITMFVIAVLILHSVIRREHDQGELEIEERHEIANIITRQISEIDQGKDPRMAIIEIYSEMRGKLGQAGAWDRQTYTPREFALGAVDRLGMSASIIQDLTYLYEEAKFSLHPMTEKEKDRAVDMLQHIVDELGQK